MSIDVLIEKIKEKKNPTVAGLDPRWEYIPQHIQAEAIAKYGKTNQAVGEALLAFNKGLIDSLCDIVPAVKPQSAYYEMYGLSGLAALAGTISYAKEKGMYVVLDGKRNDIGKTAEAYSAAYLGGVMAGDIDVKNELESDGLTVNGYLGTDGILPFVKDCDKAGKIIFVLVKTSNPSSGELQDLTVGEETIYQKMASMVTRWGEGLEGKYGYTPVGAVVGATYPKQLKELRGLMPKSYILVPGYGAQGGGAQDVAGAFDTNGLGAIINSSRGIMCAWQKGDYKPEEFGKAARDEAIRMREDILQYI
ncbi:MAG: orotidine-5'-phosphate decarboxylase [Ruminococcaceae bacterium]|nr:orotidine-5'-phosphate decarboxylase [Oscillospiraceae bacterium]